MKEMYLLSLPDVLKVFYFCLWKLKLKEAKITVEIFKEIYNLELQNVV